MHPLVLVLSLVFMASIAALQPVKAEPSSALSACGACASGATQVSTSKVEALRAYELDWIAVSDDASSDSRLMNPGDAIFRLRSDRQGENFCGGYYVAPDYLSRQPELLSQNPGAIYVSANSSEGDFENVARLVGDVEVRHSQFLLSSDWAMFDRINESAHLEGNVVFRGPEFVITGFRADYRIATSEFSLDDASYVLYQSRLRGDASRIQSRRKGDQGGLLTEEFDLFARPDGPEKGILTTVYNGSFTTCPPGVTHWSVGASKIELDREEGFGSASHAVLRVQDIPVAYFPYITFPIDDRRKTGFLYPSFGSSNTGRGLFLSTPFYWNIAPAYDATITPSYTHGRGLLTEWEFRHLGALGLSKVDLGYEPEDDQYKSEHPGKEGERWGIGLDNQYYQGVFQRSEGVLAGLLDVNAVSDSDYLSDLNRSLSINDESHLQKRWQVSYTSARYQVKGLLHAYQTIDDDVLPEDRPYARLPELSFTGFDRVGGLGLSLSSDYVYFYRDNENLSGLDRANGHRFAWVPALSYQWWMPGGYLTPAIQLHHSDYFLSDQPESTDSHLSRTLPTASLDGGLVLDADWQWDGKPWRQTLEPRIFYVTTPSRDQSRIPLFDTTLQPFNYSQLFDINRYSGQDRIADSNRLTLAMSTSLRESGSGEERARFSIGQVYHFDDREVGLSADDSALTRSDSPLAGEVQLRPWPWIDLEFNGLWDARSQETMEGAFNVSLHSEDYDSIFNLSHRYINGKLEQSDISAVLPVTNQVTLMGRWLYELRDKRSIGSVAGVEYESCCYKVQFLANSYLTDDETVDHRFMIRVELTGIAGVDTGAFGRIEDAIEGFENRQQQRR